MRVAHFCDSEPTRADGVAASAALAMKLLSEDGHQVDHYFPARRSSVPIPMRQLRMAAPWLTIDPAEPVDVVHVHTHGPVGMAGYRMAAARGVPLVLTWHTDLLACADHFVEIPIGAAYCAQRLGLDWSLSDYLELTNRNGRRRSRLAALAGELVSRASIVLAPSAKTAAGIAEFGEYSELPEVWTVPTAANLPDSTTSRSELRAELGIAEDAPVVLSVGRVSPEKNPELLLRAFAEMVDVRPEARLVMLGARLGIRRVRALVRQLGLSDHVRLVPPVPRDQVNGYYQMADVMAFTSTNDTQSLVVGEAEAAGLPVVLADRSLGERPGAPTSSRVTCGGTPPLLAAALLRMLDDSGLREQTRRAGLQSANEYSADRFLSLLVGAYDFARKAQPVRVG